MMRLAIAERIIFMNYVRGENQLVSSFSLTMMFLNS